MRLRRQLAWVCITFLTIPWVATEFLKSNENALLTLQRQTLATTGQTLADGLKNREALLYANPERATQPLDEGSLQVTSVQAPPVLDGYFDEWEGIPRRRFGNERRPMYVRAASDGRQLFLAIDVADTTKRYDESGQRDNPGGDRLILSTWPEKRRQNYVIATSAPGQVRARTVDRILRSANPDSIRGYWADVANGYQIELSLPLRVATEQFGFYFIDVDEGGSSTRGNVDPLDTAAPPWLVRSTPELGTWVQQYDNTPISVQVLDRWGWPMGESMAAPVIPGVEGWLPRWIYRQVLRTPETTALPAAGMDGRITGSAIASAMGGAATDVLVVRDGDLIARRVTPILGDSGIIGLLVTEQAREWYLSMTDTAFEGLLVKGFISLVLITLALLGFAGVTSWRIEQLGQQIATLDHNQAPVPLETTRLEDEIDELAGRFNELLAGQYELQRYLQSLPQALVHEIRTPAAIISSSLESLDERGLAPAVQTELRERARSGLQRLERIIEAMNEASRLEQSITHETKTRVNLAAILVELKDAYQQTFPDWSFVCVTDHDDADVSVSPELIVQALDKLVSNATSFSPPGRTIVLRLARRGAWWRLSVMNEGPALPDTTGHLFSPLVSNRTQESDTAHAGMGLYIVSLVAAHHAGEPWATNHPDKGTVEVGFNVAA